MESFMKIVNSDNNLVFINLSKIECICFSEQRKYNTGLKNNIVEIRFRTSEIFIDSTNDFFKDNIQTLISWGFIPPIEWGFSNAV